MKQMHILLTVWKGCRSFGFLLSLIQHVCFFGKELKDSSIQQHNLHWLITDAELLCSSPPCFLNSLLSSANENTLCVTTLAHNSLQMSVFMTRTFTGHHDKMMTFKRHIRKEEPCFTPPETIELTTFFEIH